MELHQLRCFVTVAEEGGFNRASARLSMTQPAISYQVKQLEKEIGQALFYRRPRGISTTEAGRVLLHYARNLFEMVRRTQHAIDRLSGGITGEVRIGTVNSVGMYLLPKVLQCMRSEYPDARPTILFRNSNEILEALASNQVDMAIIASPPPDRRFAQEVLLVENISLVCGRKHPLFEQHKVKAGDLKDCEFIALTEENPTGRLVRAHLARIGVSGEPVVTTDNVETVKKMIEVGVGVGFLPDMITAQDVICGVRHASRFARLEIPPPLTRRIVMVTWKQLELSPAAAAFANLVRTRCSSWRDCGGPAPEGDGEDA